MSKGFTKRFKLSHYLLFTQVIASFITVCLFQTNSQIADFVGVLWNLLNALALLLACLFEDSANEKYYELVGKYIFEKLGDNLSSFFDYIMSEEYKKQSVSERVFFQKELMEIALNGTYEGKRKLARALPGLYDIDKKTTVKMIKVLRRISGTEQNEDIRRRTIEAVLAIIQKGKTKKDCKKRYCKFKNEINFIENDSTYCVIALLETLFFLRNHMEVTKKDKVEIENTRALIRSQVVKEIGKGTIDFTEEFLLDFDNCYAALEALREISYRRNTQGVMKINEFMEADGKYTKLTVIKNLYYTCPGYPNCISCGECINCNSEYMLSKILVFLTNPPDNDEYLAMPTARYFDCVCSNLKNNPDCDMAKKVLEAYFINSILLINRTAFDKFTKLIEINRDFAKEVVFDMLESLNDRASNNVEKIQKMIDQLPEEKKMHYIIKNGRIKIHINKRINYSEKVGHGMDKELMTIDSEIKRHTELVSFIGEIKKIKESRSL